MSKTSNLLENTKQMMKLFLAILLLSTLGCGASSSPEGRMKLKNTDLQQQINQLKTQQNAILDTLQAIQKRLATAKP